MKTFPYIDPATRLRMMERPQEAADVVLDTDAFNEIDDQYALSYLLRSGDRLHLGAVYAAPFLNERVESPAEGMEKSFDEIRRILRLNGADGGEPPVFRGSERFLDDEDTPVPSEAASDLAERAMRCSPERPLYVIAIAAITNVASALLLNPEIAERIVVIWLGGHALHWPHNNEFNLRQDIPAARVVLGCGVPVVLLPCFGVVQAFTVSGPELEYHLRDQNDLCNYLVDATEREAAKWYDGDGWTRTIWDVAAVAYLLDPAFMDDYLTSSPIPEYDGHFARDERRHLIRYVYNINRDALFADLFRKLSAQTRQVSL